MTYGRWGHLIGLITFASGGKRRGLHKGAATMRSIPKAVCMFKEIPFDKALEKVENPINLKIIKK